MPIVSCSSQETITVRPVICHSVIIVTGDCMRVGRFCSVKLCIMFSCMLKKMCFVRCVLMLMLTHTYTYSVQDVCEEVHRLAPKAGLHHDGVVFGSDDFCASIGTYNFID